MATIYTAPAALCTGTAAEDVSLNASDNPSKLSVVMADLAAEGEIASDDTIQFAAGTYSVAGGDFTDAGLAAYNGVAANNFNITFTSASGDPKDTIIDFVGVAADVGGFNLISAGTMRFIGLTVKNSNAAASGSGAEIEMTDGTLIIENCIIGSDGGGHNLVTIHTVTAAAKCYAKGSEFYGAANDGISAKDDSGAGGIAHVIYATNCYFHDIVGKSCQAITLHGGGVATAIYCRFENIGAENKTSGGPIGNDDDLTNEAYLFNCYVKDCAYCISNPGSMKMRGNYIENSSGMTIRAVDYTDKTIEMTENIFNMKINAAAAPLRCFLMAANAGRIVPRFDFVNNIVINRGEATNCLGEISSTGTLTLLNVVGNLVFSDESTAKNLATWISATTNITDNVFYAKHASAATYGYIYNTTANTQNIYRNIVIGSGSFQRNSTAGVTVNNGYNFYTTGLQADYQNRWTWAATNIGLTDAVILQRFPFLRNVANVNNYTQQSPVGIGTGIGVKSSTSGAAGFIGGRGFIG